MKVITLKGINCPECNTPCKYDRGEEQTRDELGSAPTFYCERCGWETPAYTNISQVVMSITGEYPEPLIAAKLLKGWAFEYTETGINVTDEGYKIVIKPYVETDTDYEMGLIFELQYPLAMEVFWFILDISDQLASHVWTCLNEHEDFCECYIYPYFGVEKDQLYLLAGTGFIPLIDFYIKDDEQQNESKSP